MKKLLSSLCSIAFLLVALVSVQAGSAMAAETITLKAIAAWDKTKIEFQAWTTFSEILDQLVAKKAPGELKIQFLGGPEVVKEAVRRAVRAAVADVWGKKPNCTVFVIEG